MQYPQVWPTSQKFKATPIYIKENWVMHVEWFGKELPENQLGYQVTRNANGHVCLGIRGILSKDDWKQMDPRASFIGFNDNMVFYADNQPHQLTPDLTSLLSHISWAAVRDPEMAQNMFGEYKMDEVWEIITDGIIHTDNVELWRRVMHDYCVGESYDPMAIDLVRDLWVRTCQVKGEPVTDMFATLDVPDDDEIIIAMPGDDVVYKHRGEQIVGKLAKAWFKAHETVHVRLDTLHWESGLPFNEQVIVDASDVALPVMEQAPVTETFNHPLTLENSFEDLDFEKWTSNVGEYFWAGGISAMLNDPQYASDARKLLRIRDYIESQMEELTGIPRIDFRISDGYFQLSERYTSERAERIWDGALKDKDYQHLVQFSAEALLDMTVTNRAVIQEWQGMGLDTDLMLNVQPMDEETYGPADAKAKLDHAARYVALNNGNLEDGANALNYVHAGMFWGQTKYVNEVIIGDRHVEILQFPNGHFFGYDAHDENKNVVEAAFALTTRNYHFAGTVEKMMESYLKSNPLSEDQQNAFLLHAKRIDLMMPSRKDFYNNDTLSEEVTKKLRDYVSEKVYEAGLFAHAKPSYIERRIDHYTKVLAQKEYYGLVALANKRRTVTQQLTNLELFSKYRGNVLDAYSGLEVVLRDKRGFKTAKMVTLDRLEALDLEASHALMNHLQEHDKKHKVLNQQARQTKGKQEEGEYQDTGVVTGMARKDFFKLSKAEKTLHLSSLSPKERASMAAKISIWPKQKLSTLQNRTIAPVAFVADQVREWLPSSLPAAAGDAEAASAYIQLLQTYQTEVYELKTFDAAFDRTLNLMADLGIYQNRCSNFTVTESEGLAKKLAILSRSKGSVPVTENERSADRLRVHFERQPDHWDFARPKYRQLAGTHEKRSFANLPQLERLERKGPEHRKTEEISAADLIGTFGFSGVEYGNWTSQKERAKYLPLVHDSFADLSDLLHLPKASLSLGGRLGLAFGSRGRGGRGAALAHFEPSNMAIALTRDNGAGSLAHEYFHALANYFYRESGSVGISGDFSKVVSTWLDRSHCDFEDMKETSLRPETQRSFIRLYTVLAYEPEEQSWDDVDIDNLVSLDGWEQAQWVLSSKRQDAKDKRKDPYWGNPVELFARGMEAMLVHKMRGQDRKNDYLIREDRVLNDRDVRYAIYPSNEHASMIAKASNAFFKQLRFEDRLVQHPYLNETKLPMMYSHNGDALSVPKELLQRLALDEVHAMLGEQVDVKVMNALYDTQGEQAAGAWLPTLKLIQLSSYFHKPGVVQHEIYHAARSLLLSDNEKAMMDDAFVKGQPEYEQLVEALKKSDQAHLIPKIEHNPEEAQAYAFELYCQGKLVMPESKSMGIFDRIKRVLKKVMGIAQENDLTSPKQLFDALRQGQLLQRDMQPYQHVGHQDEHHQAPAA